MSQPDLPSEVYVQEDLETPTLQGLSAYSVYLGGALIAGLAFSTHYFAYLVDFTSRLAVQAGQVDQNPTSLIQVYRSLSYASLIAGLMGLPLGYWYSKQPKGLRFRGVAAICLLLLAAAPVFFAYSFKYTYPPWLFAKWLYLYHDVSALQSSLYYSVGFGIVVMTLSFWGIVLGTTGQPLDISEAYGSAHWGDGEWLAEGKPQTSVGRSLSQAEDWGVPIGWRGQRMLYDRSGLHTYVQAPTGSGKTVGFVVPTLLKHPGSLLAIDIKRELYFVTARRRHEVNGEVHRLDPFAEDIDPARYNPLDLIDTSPSEDGNSTAIDDARSIANALVVKSEGSNQNPFFIDSARQLIFGLILYVCATESRENGDRHLGKVRELLMQANGQIEEPEEGTLRGTLSKMGDFSPLSSEARDGGLCAEAPARVIREQGNQFSQMGTKEFSSVASTARTQTGFLSSTHIQDSISETTFQFSEMQTREDGMSVFLSLPAERLGDYFRWLRLMIISARTELIRLPASQRKMEHPTLFMIEEAPRLGRMETIDEGLSLDRGYGIQYMIVAQSHHQLRDSYGEDMANNIMGNCRLQLMWGAATKEDAELISSLCGTQTVAFQTMDESRSRSAQGTQKSVTEKIEEQSRDLVTPDEVARISENWTFCFTRGQPPLLVRRPNYVEDEEIFGGLSDPHPEYATDGEFQKARRRRQKLGIEDPPEESGEGASDRPSIAEEAPDSSPRGDGAPAADSSEDGPTEDLAEPSSSIRNGSSSRAPVEPTSDLGDFAYAFDKDDSGAWSEGVSETVPPTSFDGARDDFAIDDSPSIDGPSRQQVMEEQKEESTTSRR